MRLRADALDEGSGAMAGSKEGKKRAAAMREMDAAAKRVQKVVGTGKGAGRTGSVLSGAFTIGVSVAMVGRCRLIPG